MTGTTSRRAIPLPPDPAVLAGLPAMVIADTIERLIAELDAREQPLVEDEPMFPGGRGFVDMGDDLPGDAEDAEAESDCCTAGDDAGTSYMGPFSAFAGGGDGLPGDPDATEANGDEKDTNGAEDEVLLFTGDSGAGCPLADPGGVEDGR